MFEALSRLFSAPKTHAEPMDTKLAVAALLVHLAAVDGAASDKERETINSLFQDQFDLNEHQVEKLITEATRLDHDAVDFYQFTAGLAKLEEEERINIIRLMWQVVYADGENHEMEDNMVWRVAELIGVSARQRTILRAQMKHS